MGRVWKASGRREETVKRSYRMYTRSSCVSSAKVKSYCLKSSLVEDPQSYGTYAETHFSLSSPETKLSGSLRVAAHDLHIPTYWQVRCPQTPTLQNVIGSAQIKHCTVSSISGGVDAAASSSSFSSVVSVGTFNAACEGDGGFIVVGDFLGEV